jgi:putative endonuclease
MMRRPCVYILASKPYGTLYTGVTSDLHKRMAQHAQGLIDGFSKTYGISTLVYYEMHEAMDAAIAREKRIKRWRREWKYRLIEQMNPEWRNLFDSRSGEIAFGPAEAERLSADPFPDGDLDGSPPARG